MIFTNLTMLILGLNLSLNTSQYDTTGLLWIDFRQEQRSYLGWLTPYSHGRGVMSIWLKSYDNETMDYIIRHELEHLRCWRLEGNAGYVDNFIKHGGCFDEK